MHQTQMPAGPTTILPDKFKCAYARCSGTWQFKTSHIMLHIIFMLLFSM